jgi:Acyltransferase family
MISICRGSSLILWFAAKFRFVRADFDRFSAMHRFGALDGLRALSVIAVIWHHTSGMSGPATAIAGKGYLGVDFFFAKGGFLITTLLVREQKATARISLRKFYARRTLRIFSLYYVTLLLYIAPEAAVALAKIRSSYTTCRRLSPIRRAGSSIRETPSISRGRWRPRSSSTCCGHHCWLRRWRSGIGESGCYWPC